MKLALTRSNWIGPIWQIILDNTTYNVRNYQVRQLIRTEAMFNFMVEAVLREFRSR